MLTTEAKIKFAQKSVEDYFTFLQTKAADKIKDLDFKKVTLIIEATNDDDECEIKFKTTIDGKNYTGTRTLKI